LSSSYNKNMKNLLPSRTVIALVLVPAITVISIMALAAWNERASEVVEDEVDVLARALAEGNEKFQELDTDNDGLKDWEEFLYQTDEQNPDTDGDGSSDGNEVARGFDPLVAGTGTTTEVTSASSTGLYFYKQDNTLTKTDVLSRDTFTTYLQLRESGGLGEEQIVEQALEQAIRENTSVESVIEYSIDDMNVVTATANTRRTYRDSYAQAAALMQRIRFDEIELFAQYLYNDDLAAFAQISANRDLYQQFVDSLLTMRVPGDIAPVHVELANNISIAIVSLDGMLQVDDDPLNSLVLSQKFDEDRNIVLKNTQALKLYFDNNRL